MAYQNTFLNGSFNYSCAESHLSEFVGTVRQVNIPVLSKSSRVLQLAKQPLVSPSYLTPIYFFTMMPSRSSIIGVVLLLLPQNILAQNDNKKFFDVDLIDIYHLARYMLGVACIVFAGFFLLYNTCALRIFLKRYRDPQVVNGVVVACTVNRNSNSSARYDIQVVFAYTPTTQTEYVKQPDVESFAGLPQEYMHVFSSYWMSPQGSKIDLYCIPDQPKSAVTKEFLDEKKASFSFLYVALMLIPILTLGAYFVSICVKIIGDFPEDKRWVGWVTFGIFSVLLLGFATATCDNAFCEYVAENFLSTQMVYRRVAVTRPPSLIMLTPPTSPGGSIPQEQRRGSLLGDPAGPHAKDLAIQHCRSQSSLTTDDE